MSNLKRLEESISLGSLENFAGLIQCRGMDKETSSGPERSRKLQRHELDRSTLNTCFKTLYTAL